MLRPTIEQTIIDLEWITFVNTLRGTHHHKSFTKAKYVQMSIRKDKFWDICANFMHMVEQIFVTLKTFNGKQLIMGREWLIIKTLEWHVLSLWNQLSSLPLNLADVMEDQFYHWWKMLTYITQRPFSIHTH